MTDRVTIILFGRVGTVHTIYSNVSRSVMMMVITILITIIIIIIIVKREKPLKHLRGRTRYASKRVCVNNTQDIKPKAIQNNI